MPEPRPWSFCFPRTPGPPYTVLGRGLAEKGTPRPCGGRLLTEAEQRWLATDPTPLGVDEEDAAPEIDRTRHCGALHVQSKAACAAIWPGIRYADGALISAYLVEGVNGDQFTLVVEVNQSLVWSLAFSACVLLYAYLAQRRVRAPLPAPTISSGPRGGGDRASPAARPRTDKRPSPPPAGHAAHRVDAGPQTDRPRSPSPPSLESISEVWVSGAGERFHLRESCRGLERAHQVYRKTRCKVCG